MVRARTARFLMFSVMMARFACVELPTTRLRCPHRPLPVETFALRGSEAPHAKGREDAERGGKGREGAARRGSHPRRLHGRLLELVHKVEDGVVRSDGLRLALEESLATEDVPVTEGERGRKRVVEGERG